MLVLVDGWLSRSVVSHEERVESTGLLALLPGFGVDSDDSVLWSDSCVETRPRGLGPPFELGLGAARWNEPESLESDVISKLSTRLSDIEELDPSPLEFWAADLARADC